ncbi:MAG: RNA-binding protein [Prolixibacteraceae bacterium]|nr:RNA-binding protein [Prolixibacteraceae bacterium]
MNIYVGNLNYSVKEEDLNELFSEYGEVVSVKLIKDRETGRAKGFAFVEMTNDDEATKAIENLDGSDLEGRNMKVNQAKPREPRTPRY